MKNKKIIIIVTLSALLSLFSLFGVTYALLFQSHTFENNIDYKTSSLELNMLYENKFTLDDLPMTDSEAQKLDLYKITINNNGIIPYQYVLRMLSTVDENVINLDYIKVQVIVNDQDILCETKDNIINCPSLKKVNNILLSNQILKNNQSIDVYIRLWLDINTPNTEIGKIFSGKLVLDAISYYDTNLNNNVISNSQNIIKEG